MIVKIDRIKDAFSENDGVWYVAVVKDADSPCRIVFMDVYKKLCVQYAKKLTESGDGE